MFSYTDLLHNVQGNCVSDVSGSCILHFRQTDVRGPFAGKLPHSFAARRNSLNSLPILTNARGLTLFHGWEDRNENINFGSQQQVGISPWTMIPQQFSLKHASAEAFHYISTAWLGPKYLRTRKACYLNCRASRMSACSLTPGFRLHVAACFFS